MRELTDRDIQMFCIMESMKELSKCIDKQVVCLIVDKDGAIVSTGINKVIECDKNCHDKEHRKCVVRHAEIVALDNLKDKEFFTGLTAYVSLFPCKSCQEAIAPYVDEIVTFGMAHKDWVSDKIFVYAHPYYSKRSADTVYPDDNEEAQALADYESYKDKRLIQDYDKEFYSRFIQKRGNLYRGCILKYTERGVKPYTISNYNSNKP